jgi:hypothetical protein
VGFAKRCAHQKTYVSAVSWLDAQNKWEVCWRGVINIAAHGFARESENKVFFLVLLCERRSLFRPTFALNPN